MDKHTKKTSKFLSKDFLYFIVSYTWNEKNNRKKMKCLIGKVAVVIIICIFVIE